MGSLLKIIHLYINEDTRVVPLSQCDDKNVKIYIGSLLKKTYVHNYVEDLT